MLEESRRIWGAGVGVWVFNLLSSSKLSSNLGVCG